MVVRERLRMKKLISIILLGGALAFTGCGSSNNDFVITNNNPGAVAPVCVDDAYQVNSNAVLTVNAANGVLANDSPAGGTASFSPASSQGGTVAGNADGSFTYTPAVNFTGNDTFTYTVTNNFGAVTCTVTITVNAVNGFFVDSVNGNDATGSFTNGQPFATIQAAAAAAPAGSDIVVRPGNYTGGINLEDGDRLLGSGSVLAQGTPVRPVLTGPVVLADGCTLDFLRIDGTAGDAVDGNGQNGGTVTNCEIASTSALGRGVAVMPGTGTWNVSDNTITGVAGLGIDLRTSGSGQMTATVNNNTITGSGFDALGVLSENTSQLTAQALGNTFTGNQAGATFEALAGDTSVMCLDMENNTNDDVYVFDRETTATLEVEEFAEPTFAGNTGTIDNGSVFEPVQPVADGACGF
jgi:Bacterial Ig domain/Right handed beta helix region